MLSSPVVMPLGVKSRSGWLGRGGNGCLEVGNDTVNGVAGFLAGELTRGNMAYRVQQFIANSKVGTILRGNHALKLGDLRDEVLQAFTGGFRRVVTDDAVE